MRFLWFLVALFLPQQCSLFACGSSDGGKDGNFQARSGQLQRVQERRPVPAAAPSEGLVFDVTGKSRTQGSCVAQPAEFGGGARDGQCVELTSCSELLHLIRGPRPNLTFLRRSLCRLVGSTPHVCCPIESVIRTAFQPDDPDDDVDGRRTVGAFPDAKQGECGMFIPDRIVGGTDAALGSWPWMALLFYDVPQHPEPVSLCGGSLITKQFVLTAAHCVVGSPNPLAYVRIGEYDVRSDPDCQSEAGPCNERVLDAEIARTFSHPQYGDKPTPVNDVALIKLAKPVDFFKVSALPVCLPFEPSGIDSPGGGELAGKEATVTGWGRTGAFERSHGSDVLQELRIPVLSMAECKRYPIYSKLALDERKHLCAGGEKNKDSCSGDSGGPLVVPGTGHNEEVYYQVGVVSFGPKLCGYHETPGIYARVTNYLAWIKSIVES